MKTIFAEAFERPQLLLKKALAGGELIRLFEWIEIDPYPGHPHRLEKESLDEWLGASGFVTNVHESGAEGRAYYGVFAR